VRTDRGAIERGGEPKTGNDSVGAVGIGHLVAESPGTKVIVALGAIGEFKLGGSFDRGDFALKILQVVAHDHGRIVLIRPGTELGHRQLRRLEGPFDSAAENDVSVHARCKPVMSDERLHRRYINEVSFAVGLEQQVGVIIPHGQHRGIVGLHLPNIMRGKVNVSWRNAPRNFIGKGGHPPGQRAGRDVRDDSMVLLFGEQIVGSPIHQARNGHVQAHRRAQCKITTGTPIGIARMGRGTDQQETTGGNVVGQRPDFVVANGFGRQADHNRIARRSAR